MTSKEPILMLVTDPSVPDLMDRLADAILGGARVVQYRDKGGTTAERVKWVRSFKSRFADALVVVNDDPDAVRNGEADGLHMSAAFTLGSPEPRPLAPGRLLGRSIHPGDIATGYSNGCDLDYVVFGTVFPSATHPGGPLAGLDGLRAAAKGIQVSMLSVPVLAIGGINATNVGDCIRAGARGVALVRSVLLASDPAQAAADTLKAMREAV